MNSQWPDRLSRQMNFVLELDNLKRVIRQNYHLEGERKENDAEHAWHFAMMALVLQEYANESVDVPRVIKMALIHDLVEIDAGDTPRYDEAGMATKAQREQQAAERIFNLLPHDQATELRALWEEFEARQTPEAKFADALDRLEAMLLNCHTQGRCWREHGVTAEKVVARNQHMAGGSMVLWQYVKSLIDDAVAKGYVQGA